MNFLNSWSKPKKILISGTILAVAGFSLLFSEFPGYGFAIHVAGDITIVFGIIYLVFPDTGKAKD